MLIVLFYVGGGLVIRVAVSITRGRSRIRNITHSLCYLYLFHIKYLD